MKLQIQAELLLVLGLGVRWGDLFCSVLLAGKWEWRGASTEGVALWEKLCFSSAQVTRRSVTQSWNRVIVLPLGKTSPLWLPQQLLELEDPAPLSLMFSEVPPLAEETKKCGSCFVVARRAAGLEGVFRSYKNHGKEKELVLGKSEVRTCIIRGLNSCNLDFKIIVTSYCYPLLQVYEVCGTLFK